MKTIKQLADEIGIDKQKVYRYIKKNHINESHQTNNVMYYDEAAENIIKQAFSQSEIYQDSASNDTVIDILLKQSETLQKELEIKNKQIEELNARLAENQKLLDQEQQLNALNQQKIMALEQKADEPEQKPRWKFWK